MSLTPALQTTHIKHEKMFFFSFGVPKPMICEHQKAKTCEVQKSVQTVMYYNSRATSTGKLCRWFTNDNN